MQLDRIIIIVSIVLKHETCMKQIVLTKLEKKPGQT